ncbi:hypothetical protein QJS10_CPA06g00938 [Acorus calamus]|uniref:Uncharacterized protein n=1 Tax=Acorus calamus TaxID=4465 RepID=A0AAV9ELW8_ACOCL|nr:hypothetical protein QJS10_CPA06g00938 [Acorus calamus]
MDSVNGSKHSPTTTNTDEEPILQSPSKNSKPKKDKSGSRSSSSDDFIQLEESELAKSPRPNPDPPELASPDAKQSPPAVQSMARSDDPNRIPSSIFNRSKSTTPQEWSVASNESLFSIHIDRRCDEDRVNQSAVSPSSESAADDESYSRNSGRSGDA